MNILIIGLAIWVIFLVCWVVASKYFKNVDTTRIKERLTGVNKVGKKKAANSARQLLLLVRREIQGSLCGKAKGGFMDKAGACDREQRARTSAKQKREWPSRQAPKPLKPPRIRLLDDAAKLLLAHCLDVVT